MNPNSPGEFIQCCYQGAKPWKTLFGLYKGRTKSLILASILFVVKSSPLWIMPVITAHVIDLVAKPGPNTPRDLAIDALIMTVVLLQNLPTHWLYIREISKMARNVEAELRGALVRRMQLLSISFFKNTRTGSLQSKVLRDVEAIDQMSRTLFDGGFNAATAIISSIAITLVRAPQFLLVFLVMVPAASMLRVFFSDTLRKNNQEFRYEIESMSAQVMGMIDMIPMTRAHAAEDAEISRVARKLRKVKQAGFELDLQNALFGAASFIVFNFFTLLSLILAAWACYTQYMPITPGDVVMLSVLFGAISNSVMQISNMLPIITKGFESIRSVGEVLESPDIEQNLGKVHVAEVNGEFIFESVGFTYRGTDRGSMHDFSLNVQPGETVAVVGPSGAGKSTLMNLILGFERPTTGRILLDGRNMNEIDLRSYRQHVGVVTQETFLFHGTLRENILYGAQDIPDAHVLAALKDANAMEFIEKLPRGLDTIIGDRGSRLSGGQKQRIAIARALIRNPRVLILDEATSALDVASEAVVQAALDRLMCGRTTFIVAHRLSTIRNAGRIVVLEEGRIAEIGSSQELLERNGLYARMCSLQQVR